jgi:hypothetical protein
MTLHVSRLPFSLDPVIREAKRRARQRRALVALGVVVLAGLAVGLAFAFRSPDGGPSGGLPTASYSQPNANLSVTYPVGWHVTTNNWTSISDPVQRFVIYSGRLPQKMGPPRAGQELGVLMEVKPPLSQDALRQFSPHPANFGARRLTPSVEGFSGNWQETTFRDRGRAFYLFIGVGDGGSALLPALLHSLDTLRIGK